MLSISRTRTHSFTHIYSRVIVHFETANRKEGEEFKVNWKDVENAVKLQFKKLKIVYSRAD